MENGEFEILTEDLRIKAIQLTNEIEAFQDRPTKASAKRARKLSLELEKLTKQWRKDSPK